MKIQTRRFIALAALLPIVALFGCQDLKDRVDTEFEQTRGNISGNKARYDTSSTKDVVPTPTPNQPPLQFSKAVHSTVDGDGGDTGDGQPEYQWVVSQTWINQRTSDIMQASSAISDSQVLAEYNAMIWALDNENNADIADHLYHIVGTDNELEVILYRVTPQMRAAFWSRLPAARVAAIDDFVETRHKGIIPSYVASLTRVMDLAPTSSVPWDRIQ